MGGPTSEHAPWERRGQGLAALRLSEARGPSGRSPKWFSSCESRCSLPPCSVWDNTHHTGGCMRFRFSIGVVAAGAWLVGCSHDPLSAPAARRLTPPWLASVPNVLCRHVSGSFVFTSFQFTSATSAVGAGNVFGDIAGTFSAEYLDLHENGAGSSVMNARHTISTAAGSITTADVIILRPDQN